MSNIMGFVENNKKAIFQTMALSFVAMFFLLNPSLSFAVDLVAKGKATIKDTFGEGSTVMYALYVLEVLSAVLLYIKTKNLTVFGGLAGVLIFTTVAFSLFS